MSKVNKKMKKVVGVIATTILCMSMSMGVLASSPTDPDRLPPVWATGLDKDGNKVSAVRKPLSQDVKEILKNEENVKEILESAGYDVKDNQDVVVLGAGDIKLAEGQEIVEVPEGGVDLDLEVTVYLNDEELEGLKDGDILYVLHQKADGTWEVLEGTVSVKYGRYTVNAHFDSLSPVAVVKVMSDGKVAVLDKNEQQVGTLEPDKGNADDKIAEDGSESEMRVVKTTTVKKSPKTGN